MLPLPLGMIICVPCLFYILLHQLQLPFSFVTVLLRCNSYTMQFSPMKSMIFFCIFKELCSHHPTKEPGPHQQSPSTFPPTPLGFGSFTLYVSVDLPILHLLCKWNHITSGLWQLMSFTSFTLYFIRRFQVSSVLEHRSVLFYGRVISLYEYTTFDLSI